MTYYSGAISWDISVYWLTGWWRRLDEVSRQKRTPWHWVTLAASNSYTTSIEPYFYLRGPFFTPIKRVWSLCYFIATAERRVSARAAERRHQLSDMRLIERSFKCLCENPANVGVTWAATQVSCRFLVRAVNRKHLTVFLLITEITARENCTKSFNKNFKCLEFVVRIQACGFKGDWREFQTLLQLLSSTHACRSHQTITDN